MRPAAGLLAAACLALSACPAAGQEPAPAPGQEPILFRADSVRDDRELGVVTAAGNVEFTQGGRTIIADMVAYDRRADVVTASGDVRLLEPSGEVLFADRLEVAGDLRDGIVENIRARLVDDARFAAAGARRRGGVTEYRKAVYTPCRPCRDDPAKAPTWQVKAAAATHDRDAGEIAYRDALLELFGMPVLYAPYLSHPGPGVRRRSGLLTPSVGSVKELGNYAAIPYYFDIAPHMDATVAPTATTEAGSGVEARFRHRLRDGEYDVWASLFQENRSRSRAAGPEVDELRGHAKSRLRYHVDETWRAGGDLFLTTDDTFLRKYRFSSEDTLENRLFAEGFLGRSYAAANAYAFRDLRAGGGDSPNVLPLLDYNHVAPGPAGGVWNLDANLAAFRRRSGRKSQRAAAVARWTRPYTLPDGQRLRLFGSVQAGAYGSGGGGRARSGSGTAGRLFPQAGAEWRLPLARTSGRLIQVIEPRASLVVAPDSQDDDVPNEDSLGVEFDDTNLMSASRFPGLDRIEGDPRVSYGLHGSLLGPGGDASSFFLGQSYRFSGDSEFGPDTGLRERFSDIVGRLRVSPAPWLDAYYRFRRHRDDWTSKRDELRMAAGTPGFRLRLDYLSVKHQGLDDDAEGDLLGERNEISGALSSRVASGWRTGVYSRRNLASDGGSLRHGAYLVYEDDCFRTRLEYSRSFTSDREIEPGDSILLQVEFKPFARVGVPAISR